MNNSMIAYDYTTHSGERYEQPVSVVEHMLGETIKDVLIGDFSSEDLGWLQEDFADDIESSDLIRQAFSYINGYTTDVQLDASLNKWYTYKRVNIDEAVQGAMDAAEEQASRLSEDGDHHTFVANARNTIRQEFRAFLLRMNTKSLATIMDTIDKSWTLGYVWYTAEPEDFAIMADVELPDECIDDILSASTPIDVVDNFGDILERVYSTHVANFIHNYMLGRRYESEEKLVEEVFSHLIQRDAETITQEELDKASKIWNLDGQLVLYV